MIFGDDKPGTVTKFLEKEVSEGLTVQELILPAAALVLIIIMKKMKKKRKSKIEKK
jgi:hypothetical protein